MKVPKLLKVCDSVSRKWLPLGIAERGGQRVGRDLQDRDPARQHEQPEQHQRIEREIGRAEHDQAGERHHAPARAGSSAPRAVGPSSTAAGKETRP
jgi:hypothetical protein